jgi:predicted phage tail protein
MKNFLNVCGVSICYILMTVYFQMLCGGVADLAVTMWNSTGLIAVAIFVGMIFLAIMALILFLVIGGIPVMLYEQLKEQRKNTEDNKYE